MKILYTRSIDHSWANSSQQDYLCDCVFHGLKSLGEEIIDAPNLWYMYKSSFGPNKKDPTDLYGRGFTIFSTIESDYGIDRTDIENKIRNQYFDLVILARVDFTSPYLSLILENYPPSKLIILDGMDPDHIFDISLINRGTYFKRELKYFDSTIFPISFAFPKEKIQPLDRNKTNYTSGTLPTYRANYIWEKEQDYYNEYNRSFFSITHCKAGWDCMRHYEIMGCRSVPVFYGLDQCPAYTCTALPKGLLLTAARIASQGQEWLSRNLDFYYDLENQIFEHFLKYCTTDMLAKYVLDTHFRRFKS